MKPKQKNNNLKMNPKASFGKLGGLRHAFGSSRISSCGGNEKNYE